MALNLTYSFTGITETKGEGWKIALPAQPVSLGLCYIKVETVTGTKLKLNIGVSITSPNGPIKNEIFSFVPDLTSTKNFIAQAYDYLKTLPEFTGAVDC